MTSLRKTDRVHRTKLQNCFSKKYIYQNPRWFGKSQGGNWVNSTFQVDPTFFYWNMERREHCLQVLTDPTKKKWKFKQIN